MSEILEITDEEVDAFIQGNTIVVVDFWAEWCSPCRAIFPAVEKMAEEYDCQVTFVKLDIDKNSASALLYAVRAIPTLLVFHEREIVARCVGSRAATTARAHLEDLLS